VTRRAVLALLALLLLGYGIRASTRWYLRRPVRLCEAGVRDQCVRAFAVQTVYCRRGDLDACEWVARRVPREATGGPFVDARDAASQRLCDAGRGTGCETIAIAHYVA
jgi:hypothetical protein